jgi:hypothetical protein
LFRSLTALLQMLHITLVSDRFLFEDGEAYIMRMPSGEGLPSPVGSVRVRGNAIADVDVTEPGPLAAMAYACTVRFLDSGESRRISFVEIAGQISADDVRRGRCDLQVPRLAAARIEVVDPQGNTLADTPAIGLVADGVTIELPGTGRAPLDVLLKPGEYLAYIRDRAETTRAFAVRGGDEDLGVITLQSVPAAT